MPAQNTGWKAATSTNIVDPEARLEDRSILHACYGVHGIHWPPPAEAQGQYRQAAAEG
jgi:hypothetical protein